jgi:hypothetical protein
VVDFDGAGYDAIWGVFGWKAAGLGDSGLQVALQVVRVVEVGYEDAGQGDSCWQVALQVVEVGYEAARGRREDICSEPVWLVVDVEGEIVQTSLS